jgi:hypothetical protein
MVEGRPTAKLCVSLFYRFGENKADAIPFEDRTIRKCWLPHTRLSQLLLELESRHHKSPDINSKMHHPPHPLSTRKTSNGGEMLALFL